ncbi:desmethyl-deoxy-podophyllotoxin synthase-like [Phragmites australis]|uniref:desmethyl-deoxy-podophyllotoxin synthase-like n=1 Tax=Phragmites australis TaxID=29695 RepID=UPI002D76900F|nr:desmethyl-deoxy-podophyllotoxin synthase-like [Phragmites australis]
MDSTSVFYCILALVPLLYLIKSQTTSVGSRYDGLRLPPGPWKLPVISSLHHMLRAQPHRVLRELSRRHGPLMSLEFGELPVIVASSREAAEEVMKTNDAFLASRPQTTTVKIMRKQGDDISLAPYGNHWRQLHKITTVELLSAKRVQSFWAIREEEVMRLVQAISSATTPAVNLSELVTSYGNDVGAHTIMSDRLSDRNAFMRYVTEAIKLAGTFRLADLYPSSRLACAMSRTILSKIEVFMDGLFKFMDGIISEHGERRTQEDSEDLIDVLLRIQKQGGLEPPLTMGNIKSVLLNLLVGSTDTVPSVLQWAMAELMRNPEAMSKAQSEVRKAFMGQMKVTEEGLTKLSYLHWVIKETLRLHPPSPILLPRESQETCRVLGYDVPKGTIVLVNAWAISRDAEYWDEPEVFKPERFETDKRDFKGRDFEFTPFGAGRRICPGIVFGLAAIQLALANLLFYFDWNLLEGVSELDMEETMGITAKMKTDIWLKPVQRVPFVSTSVE